jgi:GAF domain-containing protein
MDKALEGDRLRQLIAVGPLLVSELDLDVLLDRLLGTACQVTAAKYAALGILDTKRRELERFVTHGVSEEREREIGHRPRGLGVLGVLISDPRPLRLTEVSSHPNSSGFPAGHPPMRSFLGVPILIRGRAWGNLYLTEKRIGEFTDADEYAATTLATWAAIAVDHARLLAGATERRNRLEAAMRRLEATQAVVLAGSTEADLAPVLNFVVERGRAVVEAQSALVLQREGTDLVIAARAGDTQAEIGARLPTAESVFGEVMLTKRAARVDDPSSQLRATPTDLGVPEMRSALLVPLVYRDDVLGVMAAFDRDGGSTDFAEDDDHLLGVFAAGASAAIGQWRQPEQIG